MARPKTEAEILLDEIAAARRVTDQALDALNSAPPQDEDYRLELFIAATKSEASVIRRLTDMFPNH